MIRKELLTDSCTIEKVGLDEDRNETVLESWSLSCIRLEEGVSRILDGNGFKIAPSMTLFYDTSVSVPSGFVPEVGMKVTVSENKVLHVMGVKSMHAAHRKIEFYEAVLV